MTSMWDVFHSVRLEVDRGVSTADVRARLADGTLNGDDLIRPAGTTRWSRIAQVTEIHAPEPTPPPPPVAVEPEPDPRRKPQPEPPSTPIRLVPLSGELPTVERSPVMEFPPEVEAEEDEDATEPEIAIDPGSDVETTVELTPVQVEDPTQTTPRPAPAPAPEVLPDDEAAGPDLPELADPLAADFETEDAAEDDPASDFTLTRNSTETVEELDLAAMVDVAFQLVLFFLVTASTVVFKTLEVPRPNEDKPPEAAAQSRAKSIDELEKDYILVEVDADGAVKIDHLPVPADRAAMVEKLRVARESTGRKAMLLSADFATRHKNAVLAFDVAAEIDLQIAIAQPTGKN